MLFDHDELPIVDYDNFYTLASIKYPNTPTYVFDEHLKDIVRDITRLTNITNRIITLELPPAYDKQETYNISSYLKGDIFNRFIKVIGTSDNNPKVINELKNVDFFAVTFNYPRDIYIFNRPLSVNEIQIHCSFQVNNTIEGVPQILLDKYKDVVVAGLLAKLAVFNPAPPNSLEQRMGVEWENKYRLGIEHIKADLINQLTYRTYQFRTRYSL
jgi:hypothetical protein